MYLLMGHPLCEYDLNDGDFVAPTKQFGNVASLQKKVSFIETTTEPEALGPKE